MEEKKVIRKKIFAIRKNVSDQWVQDISIELGKQLMALPVFRHADKVMIYADYNHEVKTDYIIRAAWEAGKQVAVPKVVGKEMVFHLLTDFDQLEPGYFGIPEPVSGESVDWERALMIMPGVAFDRKNHRVGYGGGFYDRYLEKHPGLDTVALAFDFQIQDQVPYEVTDICPQVIVTETEVLFRRED
nr:5-formyltetrahydrofolate cyclo-ligase [uncultured Blautia sp.]